jgi:uncharacterized damage-inducible protein DinB
VARKLPWVERPFNFDFPVEIFPDIIERLRGTPARIEDRVRGVSTSVLTRRQGDTWSIQENIGHLLDLETLHLGRLDDYEAGLGVLRGADVSNRKTHEANHNGRALGELLGDFRRERAAFVARVEALDDSDFARTALHPRLQIPMRLVDCLVFCACHDDYHLARMTELLKLFGAR